MRMVRYRLPDDGEVRTGLVEGDEIVDFSAGGSGGLLGLLRVGTKVADGALTIAADGRRASRFGLDEVRLEPPVARPPKFLAIGFNIASHTQELGAEDTESRPELERLNLSREHVRLGYPAPRFPTFFNKQTSCVTGPHDPIWIPHDSKLVDYEGELTVVIGRRARRISEEEAPAVIAGYTVCNDVSVRDWQLDTPTHLMGKGFETHGPTGPWIVTPDEIDDPHDLRIRTWVNDELRQDGSTREYISGVSRVVSILSQVCTLEPGDLIAMGTPGGIGMIDGRYLVPGDRVRIEIEGIGAIDNPVIKEPPTMTGRREESIDAARR